MKPLTAEWVDKAENDFATAVRESHVRDNPNYDAVCFHAQQCAEKHLKACLQEAGIPFGKTHDLVILLESLLPIEPSWDEMRSDLETLTSFAVEFRYPGATADKGTADGAVDVARRVRERARASLGVMP